MFSFVSESVIRGHHIYKDKWTPQLDEILSCEGEPGNIFDTYAVAIKRTCDNATVGHVPRKISGVCCLFLRRGTITCTVTGTRKYSDDLVQGGLEVPCTLTFTGMKDDIEKVKRLWERAPSVEYPLPVTAVKKETLVTSRTSEPQSKRQKLDESTCMSNSVINLDDEAAATSTDDGESSAHWVSVEVTSRRTVTLSVLDQAVILNEGLLNDQHILFAQSILLKQFPGTKGLYNTLFVDQVATLEDKIDHGLQIFHDRSNHWIVASNIKRTDNNVEIYDSLYTSVSAKTRTHITNIFRPFPDRKPRLKMMKTQKQVGSNNCGLFAIAIATSILFGHDTSIRLNQLRMRGHLDGCFEAQTLTPFPAEIV